MIEKEKLKQVKSEGGKQKQQKRKKKQRTNKAPNTSFKMNN